MEPDRVVIWPGMWLPGTSGLCTVKHAGHRMDSRSKAGMTAGRAGTTAGQGGRTESDPATPWPGMWLPWTSGFCTVKNAGHRMDSRSGAGMTEYRLCVTRQAPLAQGIRRVVRWEAGEGWDWQRRSVPWIAARDAEKLTHCSPHYSRRRPQAPRHGRWQRATT